MCVYSKISREKLYKKIYEPCERVILENSNTDIKDIPYEDIAKLLARIYLEDKGGEENAN